MRNCHNAVLILAMLLLWLAPAAAQMTVGENTTLSLGGSLSAGYSGAFGSRDGSNHGLDFGGNSWLHGFYYNPRFLSFDFQPYYRRSQNNSIYQTITNGSGFNGTTNFFTGSHFPGSVSFSKTYDTTGQFGVPGISGITSHGNGSSFAVSWSALLPDLPTLTASYAVGGGSSSVFGANTDSNSDSHNFTLQSTYSLAGFALQGQFTHLNMDASFPAFVEGGEAQNSSTGSNSFNVSAGHTLPLRGYWSGGWNRSSFEGDYRTASTNGSTSGAINNVNTMFSFNPTRKLGLGFGAGYNDNVYGTLQQQILAAGGVTSFRDLTTNSSTYTLNAQAGYSVFSHLALYARASHYELMLPTTSRGLTQFSGNAAFDFSHRLLGALTFSVGVVDTATQEGHSGATLVGNVNFLRRVHGWELNAFFGYTQQVQTLLATYTQSMYHYGGRASRRVGSLNWLASFNGSHSGLQQYEGSSSRTEAFVTSLHYRRYSINGQYSQSRGTSILTSTGLVEIPPGVPLPLLQQPILYNAKSYGGGASFSPIRRCVVSTNYTKANSGTVGPVTPAAFQSTILNARLEYRLRKLNVEGNFTRFQQSIATGTLPGEFNTYYIRLSRWFNIF